MRRKRDHTLVGIVCLTLILALAVVIQPAQAGLGPELLLQEGQWLSFDRTAGPAHPTLLVQQADAGQVALRADLPGCRVEEVEAPGGRFSRLYGEGYGHPAETGLPDLPVLRKGVEIPFGASVTLELVAADFIEVSLSELGLHPIYPLQPPVPKIHGAQEAPPFVIDQEFYANGPRYPSSPVALGQSYIVRGHRLQPVEVWPVAYDPVAGTLRLYREVRFRLRLEGSDMAATQALAERYASPAFEARLSRQLLNYNQGRPAAHFGPDAQVGYLIITADAYYDAMVPFADLREGHGFEVTMTRLSDIPGGGSNAEIKAYIEDAYDNWPIPPSYVLLVGDTNTIPGWPSQAAGEITDLYYATMDGPDDWHPEIGRGRFPVRSVEQTTILVDKYLAYADFNGQEPWLKKAAFIASCDDWQTAEGTHNYVIDNHTEPNGYTGIFPHDPEPGGDKIYCVTYNGSTVNIRNAANDGRWVIIYSGHGSTYSWAEGQIGFSQTDVRDLTDHGFYPFIGSHACNTGNFAADEAYCETWVLQEGKGALVFWGSSDSSYWGPDDVLERAMFDSLFTEVKAYADVTAMTYDGLDAVETAYPSYARYYWETYNIMGDPGVKTFMEPDLPSFYLEVDPTAHELCSSGTVTSNVVIGSVMNYSDTVRLETGSLPGGITATIVPDAAPAPFTATLTLEVAAGTPTGDYPVAITATDDVSWTFSAQVDLRVVEGPPGAPTLTTPADGAFDQPLAPTFAWEAPPWAASYNFQLDYSPLFGAPLIDEQDLPSTSYTPGAPLEGGRCHWWHVQGDNACGAGVWADPFHFATVALEAVFYDDIESGEGQWSHQAVAGSDHWEIVTDQAHSPTHAWHVPDDGVVTDSRLWNTDPVALDEDNLLTFWHRYNFEDNYDGAVLEISTDGGGTWTDMGAHITANGYNGTISTCCGNPLGGRQAWVYDLSEWTQVEVDLSAFAGETVQVRWRIGCDYSVSDTGWYIDDVQISSPLPPNPEPALLGIDPQVGTPYAEVPVQITGENLIGLPSARLDGTWLLSATLVSSTTLDAVVPAGMAEGAYTLTLFNGDCQEATLPEAFFVIGQCVSPTVELTSSSPVELGAPMSFAATIIAGTPPYTYSWDFGGPGYGAGLDTRTATFTYTVPGHYTATVLVENDCGFDSAGVGVEVLCDAPEVLVEAGSPVMLGQPMPFSSTVTGTAPFTYSWDFGDGAGTSTETNPVYTYTAPGAFTATLLVENACGTETAAVVVQVLTPCEAPEATIITDSPVELGQPIHLTSTVTGTAPFTYSWDFGDGAGTSTEPNPTYTYTAPGAFTVTLLVGNACGQYTENVAVAVLCYEPQAAVTTSSPVELGQPIHLTSTVTGTAPFTYSWDFGDGAGTSTEPNPTYTYTAPGAFTVTLLVGNACGQDVERVAVAVLCYEPQAAVTTSSPVELGQPMHFSSTVTGTAPFTYSWDFGDGAGTSMEPNPVYTYTRAGLFTVTLTVQGRCGSTAVGELVSVEAEPRHFVYLPIVTRSSESPSR